MAGNVVGKTFDTAGNIVGKTFDAAGNLLGSTADRLGLDRVGYNRSYHGPANTSTSDNAAGYQSNSRGSSEYRQGANDRKIKYMRTFQLFVLIRSIFRQGLDSLEGGLIIHPCISD
jgi:hypothetical protein